MVLGSSEARALGHGGDGERRGWIVVDDIWGKWIKKEDEGFEIQGQKWETRNIFYGMTNGWEWKKDWMDESEKKIEPITPIEI